MEVYVSMYICSIHTITWTERKRKQKGKKHSAIRVHVRYNGQRRNDKQLSL